MSHRPDLIPTTLAPPQIPPEVRQRALAAAREAMDRADLPDLWTRLWGSRPVRLAWAASIGVLIFCHLVIGGPVSARSVKLAIPLAAAVETDDELAEIVGLERVTVELPGWEIRISRDQDHTEPPTTDEDQS